MQPGRAGADGNGQIRKDRRTTDARIDFADAVGVLRQLLEGGQSEFVGDAGIVDREYRGEDTVAADGVSMSRGGSAATKRACRQADWEKKHRTEALESEGMRRRAGRARGE